jgi:hypothetical protein
MPLKPRGTSRHWIEKLVARIEVLGQFRCWISDAIHSRGNAELGAVATVSRAQPANVNFAQIRPPSTNVERRHPVATAAGSATSMLSATAASVWNAGKLTDRSYWP